MIIGGELNTLLSSIDHRDKNTKKDISELNSTTGETELTDIYQVFHPTTAGHTFFSAANVTFSNIDHILGHKASHSKYKKHKITSCILT
jgi:exonuclease III